MVGLWERYASHPKVNGANITCLHLFQNYSISPRTHSHDNTAQQAVPRSSLAKGRMYTLIIEQAIPESVTTVGPFAQ